jgi:hypothetical protein
MASVKGVNFTKRTAEPVEKVIASQSHGRLRVQYDSYEASSLASGSDISVANYLRVQSCTTLLYILML